MFEQQAIALQKLSAASSTVTDDYLASARNLLRQIVDTPTALERLTLHRQPEDYTRNLLFGDDRLSIWALVWPPGSKTPIHDHHCSCCFGIVSGNIQEKWFNAIDAHRATEVTSRDRSARFIASMLPTGPNIHQMINAGDVEAISIHIYGYDHRTHDSSIERQYQLAKQ